MQWRRIAEKIEAELVTKSRAWGYALLNLKLVTPELLEVARGEYAMVRSDVAGSVRAQSGFRL
jgi:hypothetical protein